MQQRQQDRFHADKLVTHLLGGLLCAHEYIITFVREIWLSALYLRQMLNLLRHQQVNLLCIHAEFLEDEVHDVLRLLHHPFQDMHRLYHLLPAQLCRVHGLLHGFLSLDCKFV